MACIPASVVSVFNIYGQCNFGIVYRGKCNEHGVVCQLRFYAINEYKILHSTRFAGNLYPWNFQPLGGSLFVNIGHTRNNGFKMLRVNSGVFPFGKL